MTLDIAGIRRAVAAAAGVSLRDRAQARMRLVDIARRFRVSTNLVQEIRDGRRRQMAYQLRTLPIKREPAAMAKHARDPYCPCGCAFEFDVDVLIGLVTEYCPRGCSTTLLSRPQRRRRAG